MAAIAEVGAGPADKPVKENEPVTIFFGVFFDGTNNHRLQVLIGKKYREKQGLKEKILLGDEKSISEEFSLDCQLEEQIAQTEKEIEQRLERVEIFRKSKDEMSPYDQRYVDYEMNEVNEKKSKISGYRSVIDNDIDRFNDSFYKDKAIQNNDFTNIALLEPFYQAKENQGQNEYVYRIYVSGSGTDRNIEKIGDNKGAGFGQGSTGVIQKVIDAIACIENKLIHFVKVTDNDITINIHLFGFSRGATEARIFAHVLNRQKKEKDQKDSLWKFTFEGKNRIKNIIQNGTVEIPAMGIYDTVSSVGVLFKDTIGNKALIDVENCIDTWSKLHHKNVDDLGLNDLEIVDDVYHICALDEYRENFALIPVFESTAPKKTEIYIPGCHADVGGGYSEGYDKKVTLYAGNKYYPISPKPYHLMSSDDRKIDKYVCLDNTQWPDQNMRSCLSEIGWINPSDNGEYNYIPPISFSFDKSTQKGYNYIGLSLMREYFDYLSLFKSFSGKFNIPNDILWLKDKIVNQQEKGKFDICITVMPAVYAFLRSRYLHFSAEEYWNINQVKVNSPNFFDMTDSKGKTQKYYCRIEYTKEYCDRVDEEYNQYVKKRLEQMENHANQMLM